PILYFFLIAPSTTEIYTLSLHDALPIYPNASKLLLSGHTDTVKIGAQKWDYDPFKGDIAHGKLHGRGTTDMKSGLAALYLALESDRKSTRLNSSHVSISYAVFCLKKKTK